MKLVGVSRRVRAVGEAYLGVVRAELAGLAADLGSSGRALVGALTLLAAAAGVAFWTLGLLLYFAVELVALALPRWGAVGSVLGGFLLVTLVLLLVAKRKLAGIEPPAATLRRRLDDHQRWWTERIAVDEESDDESSQGDGE